MTSQTNQETHLANKNTHVTESKSPNAAIEAIRFALNMDEEIDGGDEGLVFLEMWLAGERDLIRRQWPDCPDAALPCVS